MRAGRRVWLVYAAREEAIERLSNSLSDCSVELGVRQVFDASHNQRMHARGSANQDAYDVDYHSGVLNRARDRGNGDVGSYGAYWTSHWRRCAQLNTSALERSLYQPLKPLLRTIERITNCSRVERTLYLPLLRHRRDEPIVNPRGDILRGGFNKSLPSSLPLALFNQHPA